MAVRVRGVPFHPYNTGGKEGKETVGKVASGQRCSEFEGTEERLFLPSISCSWRRECWSVSKAHFIVVRPPSPGTIVSEIFSNS